MTTACLCLALTLAGAQAPQTPAQTAPPDTAIIRGRVTGGDTGQPLRKAQVRLVPIGETGATNVPGLTNRTASTDADGKYEFKELPAGRYVVSASKGAYVSVTFGQPLQQMTAGGKPMDLRAGEMLERVDFTLPRGGVITGRVLDEFGEPLTGLQITAMRSQTVGGKRQLIRSGFGSTNDVGEFRMFGLAPGQYYVQAAWRRMGPGDPTSPDHTGYPLTFFPGTTIETEAQRVTVAAGQTVSDLVMALSPVKTARVEGIVVDADGRPMGGVGLQVIQSSAGFNSMSGSSVRPDGTFVFANMSAGEYTFRTEPTATRQNVAMLKVTVGSEDITDLRLVALPPATVSGRIMIDPSVTPPAAGFSLTASLEGQPMPGGMRPARVNDDLSFELTLLPGRNRISMLNLPPGWAMRSLRVSSVDVIDEGIDVKAGDTVSGVDVELTNRLASVSGLVTNSRGEAVKEYTLVLFAADSKRWKAGGRFLRTARPDQDGRFKVSGMPPADYCIIAIDTLEPGQWTDPEFLERARSQARTLTIMDGETKTIDLKIATAS